MLEGGGARSSAGVSWMPNKAYGCFWSYGASVACFGYDHPAGARAVHDTPISPRRYFACWSNSQSIQHLWLSLPVLSRPTVITIISQFPHVPILPFLLSDVLPPPPHLHSFIFVNSLSRGREAPMVVMTKHVQQWRRIFFSCTRFKGNRWIDVGESINTLYS